MATVYLHIGTPKTGTTALQNFLPANEEVLEKNNICYADLGFRYPGLGIYRNAHFLVANYRDDEGQRLYDKEDADYWKGLDMVEELSLKYPKIILSDEGIWKGSQTKENFWPRLKEDLDKRNLDIKIIVYFRRQDLWVQSHWAQKIKEGAVFNFNEYLQNPIYTEYPLDYYKYMNLLAGIFGKEALIIRVYEKGQFRGEEKMIQSDFLDIFGLKMSDGFVLDQAVYNTSLEGDYLEMKRILNALPEFHSNKHLLIRNIRLIQDEKLFPHNYKKVSFFAPKQQLDFVQSYEASNSGVAREYLHREDGRLFYEKVRELPESKIDDSELLRDTILVYGRTVDLQDAKNKELEDKIRELRAEIKDLKREGKERDREMKRQVKAIQQDLLWFRLKRKTKHLLGKDKPKQP